MFILYLKVVCCTDQKYNILILFGVFNNISQKLLRLDGVGLVHNRPSTNELKHFVKNMTLDM